MIDSFPYESWLDAEGSFNTAIGPYWTFGPGAEHDLTGTFVLTGLGLLAMILAFIGWVWLEHKKLTAQAEHLRRAGGLGGPGGS